MDDALERDHDELVAVLDAAGAAAREFLAGLDERPAGAWLEGGAGSVPRAGRERLALPDRGAGARAALDLFRSRWEAGLSGSPGPRYLGFVTGGSTPAALAGDWLVAAYDQNCQLNGETVAPHVEREALELLAELLGLDPGLSGAFVTGATVANFTALAAGRQWLGRRRGVDVAADGVWALPRVRVLAATAHSSVGKALAMLGLGRDSLEAVPALPGREAVDPEALDRRLGELAGEPVVVVATAGTVNTADFDDLVALGELKERHGFWLHVDGAFGLFAACSPDSAHLVAGLAAADSVTVDGHKWLNVPYDAAMVYCRHLERRLEVFQNVSPYLGEPVADPANYLHLVPENSRRFRALPAWLTLIAYGRQGYRELVERSVENARRLTDGLAADRRFELLAPVSLNVACFGLAGVTGAEPVRRLQRRLHESGEAYLTATVHHGRPALRAAFCNWRTTQDDVDRLLAALGRLAGG